MDDNVSSCDKNIGSIISASVSPSPTPSL
jgi:hypothetical protein